jgi:uncharacterized membrane protein
MSDIADNTKSRKPIVVTLLGLIVCGGLLAMPGLAGPPNGEALPDLVRFIGRFHPAILHLPIGIMTLVILLEIGAVFSKNPNNSTKIPMFFAAATSVIAVLAGFLLYQGETDGTPTETLINHLWGGIAFSCIAIIGFIIKAWTDAGASAAWLYRAMLLVGAGVMGYASHEGASITHGADYLSKYAPPSLKPLFGGVAVAEVVEKPAAEKTVYDDVVAPILEEKCWKCHNADKIKGKFRMDTYELLLKGGKEGNDLVPKDAAKSLIIVRSELPIDDDERMPPDEKPGLTADELMIVKWWINAGASPDQKLAEANPPADVAAAITKRAPVAKKHVPGEAQANAAKEADAAKAKTDGREKIQLAVTEVQKSFPGAVQFESQDSNGLTFTAVSMRGKFSDEDMAKIGPVIGNLVSADLSASLITDKSLALLTGAANLKNLRVSETKITDAGIDSIVKMTSLESLNIYATEITDAGLQKIAALKGLKKLYVWRSKVTPAGIEEFKKKLPTCVVETGI